MQFVKDITDSDGCYCDRILKYDDVNIQGSFVWQLPIVSYKVLIEAFTLDGNLIEDVTSDYDSSVFIGGQTYVNGLKYNQYWVNIQSQRLSDTICGVKCFRLRVTVTGEQHILGYKNTITLFKSFTDCMTIDNCCIKASNITINLS